jgi:peroxiredoxin
VHVSDAALAGESAPAPPPIALYHVGFDITRLALEKGSGNWESQNMIETILRRGEVVPSFTLPDAEGRPVRRTQYRGRRHLVLVFMPSAADEGARAYLRALGDEYAAIRETGGEVLAILQADVAGARAAKGEIELPFPVLSDADGKTAARFMPPGARAAVFVTDRYGELYYSMASAATTTLPPVAELRAWLEAIDRQCAI